MTIWNLGSINVDHVYQVPHFVAPGETLAARAYSWGLGGKGLNQTVAIARSGGDVRHMGAIHQGDETTRAAAAEWGVHGLWGVEAATGHTIIQISPAGENCIVLAPGANRAIPEARVIDTLKAAKPGDWLLLQNETNAGLTAAKTAKAKGMKVCYAAAPFDAAAVAELIGHIDLLSVNEGELAQLQSSLQSSLQTSLGVDIPLLVTLGGKGAYYEADGNRQSIQAFQTDVVDTTGAGDTFLGAFLAKFDQGNPVEACLRWASAAAALQVSRLGAAPVIPHAQEIDHVLKAQP